jgi:hypothetical protein
MSQFLPSRANRSQVPSAGCQNDYVADCDITVAKGGQDGLDHLDDQPSCHHVSQSHADDIPALEFVEQRHRIADCSSACF